MTLARRDVSATMLLYTTIFFNVAFFVDPNFYDGSFGVWHSHRTTSLLSTIVSMFTHGSWEHLVGNMVSLSVSGAIVFHGSSAWTNPLAFVWIYFGSEAASILGCRVLAEVLQQQWQGKLATARDGWHRWVPFGVRDAYATLSNAEEFAQLKAWQYTPAIGASAAVFGVMGAEAYGYLALGNKASRGRVLFLLGQIATEFSMTPLSLAQVSSFYEQGTIDHAAHAFGFLGGFLLAGAWDALDRFLEKRSERAPGRHEGHPGFRASPDSVTGEARASSWLMLDYAGSFLIGVLVLYGAAVRNE